MEQTTQSQKITMDFLFKRNNRNRHFQIIKENRWLTIGRVFTGLGLYKEIRECGRLELVGKTEYVDRYEAKNFERNTQIREAIAEEILACVRIGKDEKIATRYSSGEIKKTMGLEYEC